MCKQTNSSTDGTSFQAVTIFASINDLTKALGEANYVDNSGEDKVNFEWNMETKAGDVFTIYDWKEYRVLNNSEVIQFHIGSFSKTISNIAQYEVQKRLNEVFN